MARELPDRRGGHRKGNVVVKIFVGLLQFGQLTAGMVDVSSGGFFQNVRQAVAVSHACFRPITEITAAGGCGTRHQVGEAGPQPSQLGGDSVGQFRDVLAALVPPATAFP